MSTLTDKLSRWLGTWHRIRLEAQIVEIDCTIDGIRQMRRHDEECERELNRRRAYLARCLQITAHAGMPQAPATNVHELTRK